MGIKNLVPRLPERGKIKIGMLGPEKRSRQGKTFRMPEKLDHFRITHSDRGPDGNFVLDTEAHEEFGEKPTEVPVRLLYDDPDLNFPTRYAAYKGRSLWCSGDGETPQRLGDDGTRFELPCPCEKADPAYTGTDKCKMNGKLSVLLDLPGKAGVGGVWTFRTTSYNSILSIMSSLQFLRALTGGPLANIPLVMRVQSKEGTTPDGGTQTVYFVTIEYAGSEEELIERGQTVALTRAKAKVSIEHIEEQARKALALAPPDVILPGDETEDVVDEFYPDQRRADAGDAPPRPTRADFENAEDGGEVTAEPVEETEPVYEFISEVGEVLSSELSALDWLDYYAHHLARLKDLRAAETFIENNAEMAKMIVDSDRVGNAAEVVEDANRGARERLKPPPVQARPNDVPDYLTGDQGLLESVGGGDR